jgi:hypothetical protein
VSSASWAAGAPVQVACIAAHAGTIPGEGSGVGLGVGTGEDDAVGVGLGEAIGDDVGEADPEELDWVPQPASARIASRATSLIVEPTPTPGG